MFPALTKKKSSKSIDVVNEPNNDIKLTLALPGTTAKGVQKEVAKNILVEIDSKWDKMYGSKFIETITKIPETKLKIRDSPNTKRKKRRKEQKQNKTINREKYGLRGEGCRCFLWHKAVKKHV